jgi:hypothetical protein
MENHFRSDNFPAPHYLLSAFKMRLSAGFVLLWAAAKQHWEKAGFSR